MDKLRTKQNRLIMLYDTVQKPKAVLTGLVVCEWRHYDAADESYFQYIEVLSAGNIVKRYYRMVPPDVAENFNPDTLLNHEMGPWSEAIRRLRGTQNSDWEARWVISEIYGGRHEPTLR
jgi:hypothetical protein